MKALPRIKGFTLIELLVYMAIMGFIIVVAGRVFSDSAEMRVRSQNMVKSMEEAGQAANFIKEDISQMGAKTWAKEKNTINPEEEGYYEIGMDNNAAMVYWGYNVNYDAIKDFSSYELTREDNFDKISFRKVDYDEENGKYRSVQEISWFVEEGGKLIRACRTLVGSASNDCLEKVEMAKDITRFKLLPSMPGTGDNSISSVCAQEASCHTDTLMFGGAGNLTFSLHARTGDIYPSATGAGIAGASVSLSKFMQATENPKTTSGQFYLGAANAADWTECKKFTFERGETYAIEFDIPYETDKKIGGRGQDFYNFMAATFKPGEDHLSIGLRKNGDAISGKFPDFLFYPPQDDASRKRYFEFGVPEDTDACLAITIALYGAAKDGKITFGNFKVYRKLDRAYHFHKEEDDNYNNYNPGTTDGVYFEEKAFVKAFKLNLEVKKKGARGKSEISESSAVIPVPNNGIKAKPREGV